MDAVQDNKTSSRRDCRLQFSNICITVSIAVVQGCTHVKILFYSFVQVRLFSSEDGTSIIIQWLICIRRVLCFKIIAREENMIFWTAA